MIQEKHWKNIQVPTDFCGMETDPDSVIDTETISDIIISLRVLIFKIYTFT